MTDRATNDSVTNDARMTHPSAGGAAVASAPRVARSSALLPIGARVNEFEILETLGEGGFGIVYRASDHSLRRAVALKEYMPAVLAARSDTQRVSVKSGEHVQTFLAGLRSFINEAQLLAQFDHPALVKVYRFCEANGTAYMAMPLYEGGTLKQALRARAARGGAPPDEGWLRALVEPLLDALELLHRENCLHRDISPDNILLLGGDRPDPKPLLLDFGAARRVIGEQTQALTVILKPGYAPIEQYDETPGLKQGPWTDIYALAAVLHMAIVGKPPPQAVGRLLQDSCEPLAGLPGRLGRYSDQFLAAIDHALAPLPQDRPQDIASWRAELGIRPRALGEPDIRTMVLPRTKPVAAEPHAPAVAARAPRRRAARGVLWTVLGLVFAASVLGALKLYRKAHPAPTGQTAAPHGKLAPAPVPAPQVTTQAAPPPAHDESEDAAKAVQEPESVAAMPNWVRENLREARQCLVAKRYACTIERAEEVLKAEPAQPSALRLVHLAREAMQARKKQ